MLNLQNFLSMSSKGNKSLILSNKCTQRFSTGMLDIDRYKELD